MLRQKLQHKLLQKLSPQQIQLMKLLQVPSASLEQRIQEELEANPALEEGDSELQDDELKESAAENSEVGEDGENSSEEFDYTDYYDDDEAAYKSYNASERYNPEEENRSTPVAVGTTFHEYLLEQLSTLDLDDRDYQIANQIIGSIDNDGYLRREVESIIDDLAFTYNVQVTHEEVENLIQAIQEFDPPGIGARDLQECLLLQLKRRPEKYVAINLAIEMLETQFDAFSKKHYTKLKSVFSIDDDLLKKAMGEILKLNPKPGSSYTGNTAKIQQYIIPDFIVTNVSGELQLALNGRNAPDLHVSQSFKEMVESYNASKEKSKRLKDEILFIKQKIDSAKWFIDAVKQRQQTMTLTMKAILKWQNDFFVFGDEMKLKPMILKNIADETGLDISTVSRVANSKYVQTEFGTFLLKNFFSESLTKDDGEEVSTREVKKILENTIAAEDKQKPLSDQHLMEVLQEKGYNIARRTVAKYREQLNIPVARMRKEI